MACTRKRLGTCKLSSGNSDFAQLLHMHNTRHYGEQELCNLSGDRLIVCTGEKAGMVLSYGFLISTLAQQYLSVLSFFSFTG